MTQRISLPNGCYCSKISVNPKNWKTCDSKALKKDWQIQYYFYDPAFPKPKLVPIKGMNRYKTLAERRQVVKLLIEDEMHVLLEGYNPFHKRIIPDVNITSRELHAKLPLVTALRAAADKIECSKEHKDQIRYSLNRFEIAVKKLGFQRVCIYDFKRSQLKLVLETMNLTPYYYNKVRSYLSSLYVELIEWECCETNIVRDIKKRTTVKHLREVLTLEMVDKILEFIKDDFYEFYRYAKIFEYSASRSRELMSVQAKNVRLEMQEYDVLIKKGKQYTWTTRPIIQNAIPFWKEIISLCNNADDYIFSHGLVPGKEKNSSKQITIRWRDHVKKKLVFKNDEVFLKKELDLQGDSSYSAITADFYSMKHSLLDRIDQQQGIEAAMGMGAHTKQSTTSIYTVGRASRKNEQLKQLQV